MPLRTMTDETGERAGTSRHRGDHVAVVVNGFLTGAGSLDLATGSITVTAIITTLAVVLAVMVTRGPGRRG